MIALSGFVLLGATLAVLALGIGEYDVSWPAVFDVLSGRNASFDRVVVLEFRMPRAVLGLVVGGALGAAGAIFQALTRNPLGSPDIIGFTTGAYTGALAVIATVGANYWLTAAGSLITGLATAAVVYALARTRGTVQGFRLIVIGIAVSAALGAFNQWVTLTIDLRAAVTAGIWQQGSLNGVDWSQTAPATALVVALAIPLTLLSPAMQALQLGDDAAGALGVDCARVRARLFGLGVALVAVTVAAAGPISFVALVAPQLARRVAGTAGVGLAASAVLGASLLVSSDLVAQRMLGSTQLPVGTVTVCLGGAYLIGLLVVQVRRGRW